MKTFFKIVAIFLSVIVVAVAVGMIVWQVMDRVNGHLVSSGERREYLLHVPSSYDPSSAVPLVITLHGFAQWPANQASVSQWNKLADEEGFIVVYPSGTGFPKRWRAAWDGNDPQSVDIEVQYFRDLLDQLSRDYTIDPDRVYVNGLSNGAGMALRLACALPERVTAIGGVAGAYLVDLGECSGGVPGIFFHGMADPIVPFEGGPSERFAQPFPNIPGFVDDFSQLNGCGASPQTFLSKGNVTGKLYEGCDPYADVVFYIIADGGHTWPGGKALPERITGKTSDELDATRLMWDFFVEQTDDGN
jgi:polyhydroxybutyrate depolymerase